ncbi:MAG TPA: hypothetical protein VK427_14480, partial [Kofleriaceae bacterium]|nr:hypothetical protein [Kofleriaceae bacterium]
MNPLLQPDKEKALREDLMLDVRPDLFGGHRSESEDDADEASERDPRQARLWQRPAGGGGSGVGTPPTGPAADEVMRDFREVNGEPDVAKPKQRANGVGTPPTGPAADEVMRDFRAVNGEPAGAQPDDRERGVGTPPTGAAADEVMRDFWAVNGVGTPPTGPAADEVMRDFRAVNGIGTPPTGPAADEVMRDFREVNGDLDVTKPQASTGEKPTGNATHVAPTVIAHDAHEARHEAHALRRDTLLEMHGKPATDAAAHGRPHGPVPIATELAGAPKHGVPAVDDAALGHDPADLAGIDPRGTAKPDVATQATAIERLGIQPIVDEDGEGPQLEMEPEPQLGPIAEQAKTVEEVDAARQQKAAAVHANVHAKQAKVATKHAPAKHRTQAAHHKLLAQQQGHRAAATHKHSLQHAQQRKHATKDELRAKLTTAATQKKAELTQKFDAKQGELDTKLQARIAKLVADQEKENLRVTQELDKEAAKLEANIAKRKAAHDKQIEQERATLEKQNVKEQETCRNKAKADSDAIKAEAAKQAAATKTNAETRATEVTAKGTAEAKAAEASGAAKAQEAIDAAEKRAAQLDSDHKDEATGVRAEGQSRAKMARDAAAKRAEEIRNKATADAKALRDKGKADHDKQIADGDTRAQKALSNGEDAAKKVQAATDKAVAGMHSKSQAAVAAMQAEVAKLKSDTEAKRQAMNTKAQTGLEEVRKKAETEKAKAVEEMTKARDQAITQIDTKVQVDLAKIDAASDKDLGRLERQIDQDIAQINAAVQRAEHQLDQSVARAERKTEAAIAKERAQIHADATKLVASIDQQAAQAKQRIAAADKSTSKDIHAAATRGAAEIAATSTKAQADLQAANQKLVQETTDQGNADRAAADKVAADSQKAMETSRTALDKEINQAWVDDAVKKANTKLDDNGIFNVVTDGEANEAMNILSSLPADQQGEAIKQLDKAAFDNLLDQVPEKRREEFKSLVENTHDPERKLKLWGEQHKSQVENDAEREKALTADEGHWWSRSDEQKRIKRLNDRRDDIVDSSTHEVDDELAVLLANGSLTEADVQRMIDRKDHEHKIEMKYNVNLTNKDGTRADGSKIAWSDSELTQVESALAHMPEGHVKDNTLLKEIKRSDVHPTKPNSVGGNHNDGVIQVFDLGITGGYRHTGDKHELTAPQTGVNGQPLSKTGDNLAQLEEVLNHEFGHDIHDQNPDAFKKYQQAAGWQQNVGDSQMSTNGLTPAQIADLKAGKGRYNGSDGKVYIPDPYDT